MPRHTPNLTGNKIIRAISVDVALMPHVSDAITALTNLYSWVKIGDDVNDIIDECKDYIEQWYNNMFIGAVYGFAVDPPVGWLLLDGSTYAKVDYPELSSLLPSHLISGDNFTLPDATDAFPYGVQDHNNGMIVTGSNSITLTEAQLPPHTHTYTPPTLTIPAGPPPQVNVAGIGTPTDTGSAGSGDSVDIRPKRFGLVFAIYAGRE